MTPTLNVFGWIVLLDYSEPRFYFIGLDILVASLSSSSLKTVLVMFSEEKNVVTIFHLWLGFSANFWESSLRSIQPDYICTNNQRNKGKERGDFQAEGAYMQRWEAWENVVQEKNCEPFLGHIWWPEKDGSRTVARHHDVCHTREQHFILVWNPLPRTCFWLFK